MARLKLGILISGRGSNLQALIDACAAPEFPAEIAIVVSNRPEAGGLDRARQAGIEGVVIDHREFGDRATFERELIAALDQRGVELVCLAGFMRLLTPTFVDRWRDRLINIHPSLLPAFRGLHSDERAIDSGVRFSGCTVHFVRPEMDDGPIVIQAAVPVLPGDDADALSARILEAEHRIYPAAVRLIAEGRARIVDERVVIEGEHAPVGTAFNPPA